MSTADARATIPLLSEAELQQRWELTLRSQATQAITDPGYSYRPIEAATVLDAPPQAGPAPLSQGPFSIVEELGRGGMGVVYRARQEALEREVALKTVLGESDLRARSAFLAEARVTGWLEHPNIVPVHSLDLDPQSGQPFLSMKVVRGFSWKELLHPETPEQKAKASGRKWPRADLEVLKAVCNALAFAHDRGIAHLDLKPENIMLGDFGEVLVMDWGTALDIRDGPVTESIGGQLSRTRLRHKSELSSPCGTPIYMAPELANGEGRLCGPWTDVYLLGAILYEILTGRPPHQGSGLLQVIGKAARGEPPEFRPEDRARAPEELRNICGRAMAREPADRYPDVSSFARALDDFLEQAESHKLCEVAEAALLKADESLGQRGLWTDERRAEIYGELAEAAGGFRQALALWPENPRARHGAEAAQTLYVKTALENGDLNTARAQARILGQESEEARELHQAITAATVTRQEREADQARRRRLAWGLAIPALIALVFGAGLFYYVDKTKRDQYQQSLEDQYREVRRQQGAVEDAKNALAKEQEEHRKTVIKAREKIVAERRRAKADIARTNERIRKTNEQLIKKQQRRNALEKEAAKLRRALADGRDPALGADLCIQELRALGVQDGKLGLELSLGSVSPQASAGRVLASVEARLRRADGRPLQLGPGGARDTRVYTFVEAPAILEREPGGARAKVKLIVPAISPGRYLLRVLLKAKGQEGWVLIDQIERAIELP